MLTEKEVLQQLKKEVEALKKKIDHPSAQVKELLLEMESLKDSLQELNTVFKKALNEAQGEDLSVSILQIKEKISTLISQNETIAQGMVALSDKLGGAQVFSSAAKRPQHQIGPPLPSSARIAPRPTLPILPEDRAAPLPPPQFKLKKRKGLGSLFK